jgi:hypothetical protein
MYFALSSVMRLLKMLYQLLQSVRVKGMAVRQEWRRRGNIDRSLL